MKLKMNAAMRGILTTICIAILSVALVPNAFAETQGDGDRHAQHSMDEGDHSGLGHGGKMERMAEFLELSESQQTQIEQIREDGRTATSELRQQHRVNREKVRALTEADVFDEAAVRSLAVESAQQQVELTVSKARTHHAIHSILTPEQRLLAEKMKAMKRGGKGRHTEERGMRGSRQ